MYDKEKHKIYREKQKHKMGSYQISYREKRRLLIHKMKKTLACVYCGLKNPLCLEFDHIDRSQKKGILATMITGGYKWQDVLDEIAKCQPVCANCHRIKSNLEANKLKAVEEDISEFIPKKLFEEFKLSMSPTHCGKAQLACDHYTSIPSSTQALQPDD